MSQRALEKGDGSDSCSCCVLRYFWLWCNEWANIWRNEGLKIPWLPFNEHLTCRIGVRRCSQGGQRVGTLRGIRKQSNCWGPKPRRLNSLVGDAKNLRSVSSEMMVELLIYRSKPRKRETWQMGWWRTSKEDSMGKASRSCTFLITLKKW